MSAKDNFAQAMKELLNAGDGEGAAAEKEESSVPPSSFSSFSQPDNRPPKAPAPEKKTESVFAGGPLPGEELKEEEEQAAMDFEEPAVAEEPEEVVIEEVEEVVVQEEEPAPSVFSAPAAPAPSVMAQTAPAGSGEVTTIAAGTTVVGDINTAGGLTLNGDVKGNLQVSTTLALNGKVIGDIEAEDVAIVGSLVRGNIKVRNVFTMDDATTVVGDVSAKNVKVNGKIKGNLTVVERGHFEPKATLVGNLISGTVIIDEGAMLKGDIAITNAQNENISVDEPDFDIEI